MLQRVLLLTWLPLLAACGGSRSSPAEPPAFQPSPNIAATHGYLQGLYIGEVRDADGVGAIAFVDLFDDFPAAASVQGELVVGAPWFGTTQMVLEADGDEIRMQVGDAQFVGSIEWPDLVLSWVSPAGFGTARLRKTYAQPR